jgi:hypothetical protein
VCSGAMHESGGALTCELWRYPDLKGVLGSCVANAVGNFKVALHHIKKSVVVALFDARVTHDADAVLVQGLRNLVALQPVLVFVLVPGIVLFKVNHRQRQHVARRLILTSTSAILFLLPASPLPVKDYRKARGSYKSRNREDTALGSAHITSLLEANHLQGVLGT